MSTMGEKHTALAMLFDEPNACEMETGRELVVFEIDPGGGEDVRRRADEAVRSAFPGQAFVIAGTMPGEPGSIEEFWDELDAASESDVRAAADTRDEMAWIEHVEEKGDEDMDSRGPATVAVRTQLLDADMGLPAYATEGAAGCDLRAAVPEPVVIAPHSTEMIPTGIAVAVPDGFFAGIYARSGLASKRGLRPANAVGVVDSDYTGPVMVALHNDGDEPAAIEPGERIAQMVIQPYVKAVFEVVERLDATERGDGGFGSTGRS